MATDYETKIADVKEQIARLENRRRELSQKHKAAERKARTKRLIERVAIVESVTPGAEGLTNEQFKSFIERIADTAEARRALSEIAARGGGEIAGVRDKSDTHSGDTTHTKTAETKTITDAEDNEDTGE
jgi:phage shock protein A